MSDMSKGMLPYAEKWDALGTLVQTTRFWTRWGPIIVVTIFVLGALGGDWLDHTAAWQNSGTYLFVFCFGAILVYLARVGYAYFLLFSFKCPRCQDRWPSLLNKAPLCESCGLRLYHDS
jgi:hypothetical protein